VLALLFAAILGLTACGSAADGTNAAGGNTAGTARDAGTSPTGVVRVAAAADLQFALEEIVTSFETDTGSEVKTTYGSSGVFYQQLRNGAPFDLYLSADLQYPEMLVDEGLADRANLFEYAVGRLVVWVPNGSPVDPAAGIAAMAAPEVRKAAIANPDHAPYGVAAVAAMQSAGVYESAADRLVLGENVAQAAEFVQSGNADVGIIALSLALSPPMAGTGEFTEVPLDTFPTLRQGGVILGSARNPTAAQALREALLSPPGREILAHYGFLPPAG
jgi:molybdate transport system substrate-binding protein